MSTVSGLEVPIEDEVGDANAILLLVPSMDPADDAGCSRLLSHGDAGGKNVLCVTLNDAPDDRMAAWRTYMDDEPASVCFVDVGDTARSAAAVGASIDVPGESITVRGVSSPSDLTGLGMRITELMREYDGTDTALCFHTLTTLLQYVDVQRVFQFLHVLTGRLGTAGVVGHFHMDPTAHDDREINTLTTLFDAVVELDDDGEWVVRSR